MSDTPPDLPIAPARKSWRDRFSIVWALPIAALLAALAVAWQSYDSRGPLVEIEFENASGVQAGTTEIKYRNVTVGVVEDVTFTPSLDKVLVRARMEKEVASFIDEEAKFWVVRPQVSARGVTGLGTVLSGVYIEGLWDTTPGGLQRRFEGLPDAPLDASGKDGLRFRIRASGEARIVDQAPILYRGIEVGSLGEAQISEDGSSAIVEAFIEAPHDRLITTSTRFWNVSGFSFNLGPQGAEIGFSSLATLIGGGVEFDTVISGGGPVGEDEVFELYGSEGAARNSVFENDGSDPISIGVVFDENVAGLATGAQVEFRGLRIGQVSSISGVVDPTVYGDNRVRLFSVLAIRPERLGLEGGDTDALTFLADRVREGLRARLVTSSILTGGLKVELIFDDDAPAAELDLDADPFPIFPSTSSEISDATATAEGVLKRVNDLPIEELLFNAISFLDAATALIANEELQQTPADIRALLVSLQGLVGSEDAQNVPVALNAALSELEAFAASLNENDGAARLLTAVDKASVAAEKFGVAMEGLPALTAELEALAGKAGELPLDELMTELTGLISSVETVVGDPETRAIPATLNRTLAELEAIVSDYNENEGTARLLSAIDATFDAAGRVGASVEGVPALIKELEGVAAKAEALPVEALLEELTALAGSIDRIASDEATAALPGSLSTALEELTTLIGEINANDGAGKLTELIDNAALAARDLQGSAAGLPDLIAQIQAVAAKAEALPVEALIEELTTLTRTADEVLGVDAAKELPQALNDALAQISALLEELRTGGTIENVNATLASTRNAADALARTSDQLPALLARAGSVLDQTAATLAAYDEKSTLNRDARAAMREIEKAAAAVSALARTLERRPNALILGK